MIKIGVRADGHTATDNSRTRICGKNPKRYVLDIFVDKDYVYKDGMVITFHFTDDKHELSDGERLKQ